MTSNCFKIRFRCGRQGQRGVTLVETLVALLVLSIGLLGVAGLQMAALRNNHGAHLRSQATVLAYDIADRMRANRTNAGLYVVAFGATLSGGTLPAIDVVAWKAALASALPAGDGAIEVSGNMMVIRVRWTDRFGTENFATNTRI